MVARDAILVCDGQFIFKCWDEECGPDGRQVASLFASIIEIWRR